MSSHLMYEAASKTVADKGRLFAVNAAVWAERKKDAERALFDAASLTTKNGEAIRPRGIISKDILNMSVCGLVFDKDPGNGFTTAPQQVENAVRHVSKSLSLPANAIVVFPDVNTSVGTRVLQQMRELSAINEDRPLLGLDNEGVRSVVLEDDALVFSGATVSKDDPSKVFIAAAPSAVAPAAKVVRASEPDKHASQSLEIAPPATPMRPGVN